MYMPIIPTCTNIILIFSINYTESLMNVLVIFGFVLLKLNFASAFRIGCTRGSEKIHGGHSGTRWSFGTPSANRKKL